jgi:hypothetical protein
MRSVSRRIGWILAPVLAFGVVSVRAANDRITAKRAVTSASSTAPDAARPARASFAVKATTILGTAWHSDDTPIGGANLRLRNVVTGKIVAVTKANDAGEFRFENVEPGNYVIELVSDSGHLRTTGNVFTIAPGETVATFVRLGAKIPWASAVFSSTAASVAATAATAGIIAISPSGHCQSPPCH